jgi:hypothetical protein
VIAIIKIKIIIEIKKKSPDKYKNLLSSVNHPYGGPEIIVIL